ncbi:gluconokinase [Corynebacterium kutscheri]
MGVSGSGKSTVGALLAPLLGIDYRDGDDMHPQENIDKMAQGIALNDKDRWPWLESIGSWLAQQPDGAIVGCSALKRSYRDLIRSHCNTVIFVHVHGDFDTLYQRMNNRPGHFMPPTLLQSQWDTLEALSADEVGRVFDILDPPEKIAQQAASWIREVAVS